MAPPGAGRAASAIARPSPNGHQRSSAPPGTAQPGPQSRPPAAAQQSQPASSGELASQLQELSQGQQAAKQPDPVQRPASRLGGMVIVTPAHPEGLKLLEERRRQGAKTSIEVHALAGSAACLRLLNPDHSSTDALNVLSRCMSSAIVCAELLCAAMTMCDREAWACDRLGKRHVNGAMQASSSGQPTTASKSSHSAVLTVPRPSSRGSGIAAIHANPQRRAGSNLPRQSSDASNGGGSGDSNNNTAYHSASDSASNPDANVVSHKLKRKKTKGRGGGSAAAPNQPAVERAA